MSSEHTTIDGLIFQVPSINRIYTNKGTKYYIYCIHKLVRSRNIHVVELAYIYNVYNVLYNINTETCICMR